MQRSFFLFDSKPRRLTGRREAGTIERNTVNKFV
jgi:hypothetical protein